MKQQKTVETANADLDYELWALLSVTSHMMARAREIELRRHGFSMMQHAVLWAINTVPPPATPSRVARFMVRKPNTMSTMLQRLEKMGFIRSVRDSRKKDGIVLVLTHKGEKAFDDGQGAISAVRKTFSCLSKTEKRKLATTLRTLRRSAFTQLVTAENML